MKKLLVSVLCLIIAFAVISCGKKEVKEENTKAPEDAIASVENLTETAEENIEKLKEDVLSVKENLEKESETLAKESAEVYQNRQASVALMEDALSKIEQGKKEGNDALIEEGKTLLQMANTLWNYEE